MLTPEVNRVKNPKYWDRLTAVRLAVIFAGLFLVNSGTKQATVMLGVLLAIAGSVWLIHSFIRSAIRELTLKQLVLLALLVLVPVVALNLLR